MAMNQDIILQGQRNIHDSGLCPWLDDDCNIHGVGAEELVRLVCGLQTVDLDGGEWAGDIRLSEYGEDSLWSQPPEEARLVYSTRP